MQYSGLDQLAAQHDAVAVYLYVPKALVKRKGFNLEWSGSHEARGGHEREAFSHVNAMQTARISKISRRPGPG